MCLFDIRRLCFSSSNKVRHEYEQEIVLLHVDTCIMFVSYEVSLKSRGHNWREKSPSCWNIQEELISKYLCPISRLNYAVQCSWSVLVYSATVMYSCTVQLMITLYIAAVLYIWTVFSARTDALSGTFLP